MNNDNSKNITLDVYWVTAWILKRFYLYKDNLPKPDSEDGFVGLDAIDLKYKNSIYKKFLEVNALDLEDRLLLAMALLPHVQPYRLSVFYGALLNHDKKVLPDIGLIKGQNFQGYLPTGLTYTFTYAGRSDKRRHHIINYLHTKSRLITNGVVSIAPHYLGEPVLSGVLALDHEYWKLLTENTLEPSLDLLTLK